MEQILSGDRRQQLRSYLSLDRRTDSVARRRRLVEAALWGLVLVALVLDAHTTTIGLERGFVESNPAMRAVFAVFGVSAIWQLKTLVAVVAVGCVVLLPREDRLLVPVALGLPWAFATLSNVGLLG
jgi:uncharacterized membrane protein